jgi:hypothetical protein
MLRNATAGAAAIAMSICGDVLREEGGGGRRKNAYISIFKIGCVCYQ